MNNSLNPSGETGDILQCALLQSEISLDSNPDDFTLNYIESEEIQNNSVSFAGIQNPDIPSAICSEHSTQAEPVDVQALFEIPEKSSDQQEHSRVINEDSYNGEMEDNVNEKLQNIHASFHTVDDNHVDLKEYSGDNETIDEYMTTECLQVEEKTKLSDNTLESTSFHENLYLDTDNNPMTLIDKTGLIIDEHSVYRSPDSDNMKNTEVELESDCSIPGNNKDSPNIKTGEDKDAVVNNDVLVLTGYDIQHNDFQDVVLGINNTSQASGDNNTIACDIKANITSEKTNVSDNTSDNCVTFMEPEKSVDYDLNNDYKIEGFSVVKPECNNDVSAEVSDIKAKPFVPETPVTEAKCDLVETNMGKNENRLGSEKDSVATTVSAENEKKILIFADKLKSLSGTSKVSLVNFKKGDSNNLKGIFKIIRKSKVNDGISMISSKVALVPKLKSEVDTQTKSLGRISLIPADPSQNKNTSRFKIVNNAIVECIRQDSAVTSSEIPLTDNDLSTEVKEPQGPKKTHNEMIKKLVASKLVTLVKVPPSTSTEKPSKPAKTKVKSKTQSHNSRPTNFQAHVPRNMVIPSFVKLRDSAVDPSEIGAWCHEPIKKDEVFGPFKGRSNQRAKLTNFKQAWEVFYIESNSRKFILNATNPAYGNWLRYVNSSLIESKCNLMSVQRGTQVFYMTKRDIKIGEELVILARLIPEYYQENESATLRKIRLVSGSPDFTPSKKDVLLKVPKATITHTFKKPRKVNWKNRPSHWRRIPDDDKCEQTNDMEFKDKLVKKLKTVKKTDDLTKCLSMDLGEGAKINRVKKIDTDQPNKKILIVNVSRNSTASVANIANKDTQKSSPEKAGIKRKATTEKVNISADDKDDQEIKKPKIVEKVERQIVENRRELGKRPSKMTIPQDFLQTDKVKLVNSKPQSKQNENKGKVNNMRRYSSFSSNSSSNDKNQDKIRKIHSDEELEDGDKIEDNKMDADETENKPGLPVYRFYIEHKHHAKDEDGHSLYKCEVCSLTYTASYSLRRHFLHTHVYYKYVPDSKKNLSNVIKLYQIDNYTPPEDISNLNYNELGDVPPVVYSQKRFDRIWLPGLYRCDMCNSLFDYLDDLVYHNHLTQQKDNDKTIECEDCGMKFQFPHHLGRHRLVHAGKKPYSCYLCEHSFATPHSLRKHLQTHTGGRVSCSYCSQTFKESSHVKRHIRKSHKQHVHQCTSCNEEIFGLVALQLHLYKEHKIGSETEIELCKESFKLQGLENENEDVLSGYKQPPRVDVRSTFCKVPVKPQNVKESGFNAGSQSKFTYVCTVCKKRFRSYSSMCKHRRSIHQLHTHVEYQIQLKKRFRAPYLVPEPESDSDNELWEGTCFDPISWDPGYYDKVSKNVDYNLRYHVHGKAYDVWKREQEWSRELAEFQRNFVVQEKKFTRQIRQNHKGKKKKIWKEVSSAISYLISQIPRVKNEDMVLRILDDIVNNMCYSTEADKVVGELLTELVDNIVHQTEVEKQVRCLLNDVTKTVSDDIKLEFNLEIVAELIDNLVIDNEDSMLEMVFGDLIDMFVFNTNIEVKDVLSNLIKDVEALNYEGQNNNYSNKHTSIPQQHETILTADECINRDSSKLEDSVGVENSAMNPLESIHVYQSDCATTMKEMINDIEMEFDVNMMLAEQESLGFGFHESTYIEKNVRGVCLNGGCNTDDESEPNDEKLPGIGSMSVEKTADDSLKVSENDVTNAVDINPDALHTDTEAVVGENDASNTNTEAVDGETAGLNTDTEAVVCDTNALNTEAAVGDSDTVNTDAVDDDIDALNTDTEAGIVDTAAVMDAVLFKVENLIKTEDPDVAESMWIKQSSISEDCKNILDDIIGQIEMLQDGFFTPKKKHLSNRDAYSIDNSSASKHKYKIFQQNKNKTANEDLFNIDFERLKKFYAPTDCLRQDYDEHKCIFCKTVFATEQDYQRHYQQSHKCDNSTLESVGLAFVGNSQVDTEEHDIETHDEFSSQNYDSFKFGAHGFIHYVCSACFSIFNRRRKLIIHQKKQHPFVVCNHLQVEDGYKIDKQHFQPPSSYGLLLSPPRGKKSMSLRSEQLFACSVCEKRFDKISQLHIHILECFSLFGAPEQKSTKKKQVVMSTPVKIESKETHSSAHTKKLENETLALKSPPNKRKLIDQQDELQKKRRLVHDIKYDPEKHTRRRDMNDCIDLQQCRGCGLKFQSMRMLERHARNCENKDKFREDIKEENHRVCQYCSRSFMYVKSLLAHYDKGYCRVRRYRVDHNLLTQDDLDKEDKRRLLVDVSLSQEHSSKFMMIPIKRTGSDMLDNLMNKIQEEGRAQSLQNKKKKKSTQIKQLAGVKRKQTTDLCLKTPVVKIRKLSSIKSTRNVTVAIVKKKLIKYRNAHLSSKKSREQPNITQFLTDTKRRRIFLRSKSKQRQLKLEAKPTRFSPRGTVNEGNGSVVKEALSKVSKVRIKLDAIKMEPSKQNFATNADAKSSLSSQAKSNVESLQPLKKSMRIKKPTSKAVKHLEEVLLQKEKREKSTKEKQNTVKKPTTGQNIEKTKDEKFEEDLSKAKATQQAIEPEVSTKQVAKKTKKRSKPMVKNVMSVMEKIQLQLSKKSEDKAQINETTCTDVKENKGKTSKKASKTVVVDSPNQKGKKTTSPKKGIKKSSTKEKQTKSRKKDADFTKELRVEVDQPPKLDKPPKLSKTSKVRRKTKAANTPPKLSPAVKDEDENQTKNKNSPENGDPSEAVVILMDNDETTIDDKNDIHADDAQTDIITVTEIEGGVTNGGEGSEDLTMCNEEETEEKKVKEVTDLDILLSCCGENLIQDDDSSDAVTNSDTVDNMLMEIVHNSSNENLQGYETFSLPDSCNDDLTLLNPVYKLGDECDNEEFDDVNYEEEMQYMAKPTKSRKTVAKKKSGKCKMIKTSWY